ncbi:MAG TPA: UdgX family uracil-DNA binding protein [Caulobacteraceae bacterium]|jgi:DNA polymerase|nr:UdgX family uracil-DNA binding protein [Caulobacteraceae bacterium]
MRLIRLASETDFAGWRRAARALRLEGVAPAEARWTVGAGEGEGVFCDTREAIWRQRDRAYAKTDPGGFTVPARFLSLAQTVFQHAAPERFGLLYRLLWRLATAPDLLDNFDDPDVARARTLAREVFEGRNLAAAAAIAGASTAASETGMPTPSVSSRAARAAQRNARDGSFGGDVPAALEDVSAGVDVCRRCELWREATQGVAGEGPAHAKVMLVGEQPGDLEDLAGHPFVGPAGGVLDRALAAAGVPRGQIFVTNAVKHFKHELRGKRRLHKTPDAGEVEACRWWLDAERRLVRPRVIVALGATAALGVFGRPMPIGANRGRAHQLPDQAQGVVTYHPSYLLRIPEEAAKAQAFDAFVEDLKFAWSLAA